MTLVIGLVLGGLLYETLGNSTFLASAGIFFAAALLSLPLLTMKNHSE